MPSSIFPDHVGLDGLRATFDDATMTVSFLHPLTGEPVGTPRPYTTDEMAILRDDAYSDMEHENEQALVDLARGTLAGARATIAELNTLIDTPNVTINAGPAPYIKGLARGLRGLTRIVIAVAKVVVRDLADTDVGEG